MIKTRYGCLLYLLLLLAAAAVADCQVADAAGTPATAPIGFCMLCIAPVCALPPAAAADLLLLLTLCSSAPPAVARVIHAAPAAAWCCRKIALTPKSSSNYQARMVPLLSPSVAASPRQQQRLLVRVLGRRETMKSCLVRCMTPQRSPCRSKWSGCSSTRVRL
jgi:hypothetical protein